MTRNVWKGTLVMLGIAVALLGWSAYSAPSGTSKQTVPFIRWEYSYVLPDRSICNDKDGALVELLNKRGAEGWEVISFQAVASDGRMKIAPLDPHGQPTAMAQATSAAALYETKASACPILIKRQIVDTPPVSAR